MVDTKQCLKSAFSSLQIYLTETTSHLRSTEAQKRWLCRVTARKSAFYRKTQNVLLRNAGGPTDQHETTQSKSIFIAIHLLVVDADADVTAQLPVVPTLEFNRFLWMFLTAGYWARKG